MEEQKATKRRSKVVLGLGLLVTLVVASIILWPVLFPPYTGDPIVGKWEWKNAKELMVVHFSSSGKAFMDEVSSEDSLLFSDGELTRTKSGSYQVDFYVKGNMICECGDHGPKTLGEKLLHGLGMWEDCRERVHWCSVRFIITNSRLQPIGDFDFRTEAFIGKTFRKLLKTGM